MTQDPVDIARLIEKLSESKWFRRIDPSAWGNLTLRLRRVDLAPGEALFHQGDAGDAVYVVLAGRLKAYKVEEDGGESPLAEMAAGATVGEIQVLTGGARSATVRAACDSELARIPTEVFDELLRRSPETRRELIALNERRLHRSMLAEVLPGLFGPLDEAAFRDLQSIGHWLELRRGETLFERGDAGDSCYLLLRGRLGAVVEDEAGQEQIVGEMYRGEPVGEMALITGEARSTTVRALRDSRLVVIPREGFDQIITRYPQALMSIARTLVDRLSKTTKLAQQIDTQGDARRISNIAVVPGGGDVPLTETARRLTTALAVHGSALHVNQQSVQEIQGFRLQETQQFQVSAPDTRNDPAAMRLASWLDEQELRHRFVVYEADPGPSGWTRRCTRQADVVLMVADAGSSPGASVRELLPTPETGEMNRPDAREDVARRTMLMLIHPGGEQRPRDTGRWLDALGLDRHVHVRWDQSADFERLARLIAGRAVGLALGGGGSRAFAHIGVIRALEEAGIAIDGIGGTSAGSLIAAEYAMGWDWQTMVERNRSIFLQGNPYRDLTLPFVSVLSGRRARGLVETAFPDVEIEDLWLSYFGVSANLTTARQMIHRRGPVSAAVYASMAVPGATPPAVFGEDLLVDGGVLNNLPGDVARRLWGGRVITVDVSSETEKRFRSAGELPSAGSILRSRLSPFAEKLEVPGIFEILLRSSLLGSVQNTAAAKAEADLFLKPPVGKYGMFNMHVLDQLVEVGYQYTRKQLEDWQG